MDENSAQHNAEPSFLCLIAYDLSKTFLFTKIPLYLFSNYKHILSTGTTTASSSSYKYFPHPQQNQGLGLPHVAVAVAASLALSIRVVVTAGLPKEFVTQLLQYLKMSTGPGLESLVDQNISVITNDGRNIVGILRGFDQSTNIVLDESHERVYSTKAGVEQHVMGLYIIRGDNISIIGELDEELDSNLDLKNLRAHPLKPLIP